MHSLWSREYLKVYFKDLHIEPDKQDGRLSEQASIFSSLFPTYDAVVDCRLLLNREMIDILQRNLNASFGLLRRLAGARCIGEIIVLQAAHFNYQVAALIAQTKELADLSINATRGIFRSGGKCEAAPDQLASPRLDGADLAQLSARLRCAECGGELRSVKPWRLEDTLGKPLDRRG